MGVKTAELSRRALLLVSAASISAAPLPGVAIGMDVADGRCVVPVLLDGKIARMVLDTGAERSVLTRTAAARLGLRRDLWVDTPMVGAGGLVETHPNVDAGTGSLGGVALFQNPQMRGLSLAVTNISLGDADGLLGADVLCHHTLQLDVPRAQLMLQPPGTAVTAQNAVPLRPWARGLLLAPLRVDGHDLTALVDTGASATLINASGLYKLGLTPARLAQDPTVSTSGLGGSFRTQLHRFTSLQCGKLTIPTPLLLTAPVPELAFDAILGLDILGHQRLSLSYTALRLSFA